MNFKQAKRKHLKKNLQFMAICDECGSYFLETDKGRIETHIEANSEASFKIIIHALFHSNDKLFRFNGLKELAINDFDKYSIIFIFKNNNKFLENLKKTVEHNKNKMKFSEVEKNEFYMKGYEDGYLAANRDNNNNLRGL